MSTLCKTNTLCTQTIFYFNYQTYFNNNNARKTSLNIERKQSTIFFFLLLHAERNNHAVTLKKPPATLTFDLFSTASYRTSLYLYIFHWNDSCCNVQEGSHGHGTFCWFLFITKDIFLSDVFMPNIWMLQYFEVLTGKEGRRTLNQ